MSVERTLTICKDIDITNININRSELLGHVSRKDSNKTTKIDNTPDYKKLKGRPRLRWTDDAQ